MSEKGIEENSCIMSENKETKGNEDTKKRESSASNLNTDVIDLGEIFHTIMRNWKIYAAVLPVVFILSCLHILNVPRYFTTSTQLAPEEENATAGGSLSSIASSFGFDISDIQTTDAITPMLYPDLMNDNKFVVDLLGIKVVSYDNSINTDYYSYLTKYQKSSWTGPIIKWVNKIFATKKKSAYAIAGDKDNDPYILSKKEDDIVNKVRGDILITVDKKTGVISISATAQDPLICKTLADSVTVRLQDFITTYRTSKARKDVDYYKHLMEDALYSYETVRRKYASVSDANQDVILQSVRSELEDMENDMQLKYNQYTTYQVQYQAAIAKLRDKTPAFTTLKGANVPIKPAGPKRMIFVAGMLLLATIIISLWLAKDVIIGKKH